MPEFAPNGMIQFQYRTMSTLGILWLMSKHTKNNLDQIMISPSEGELWRKGKIVAM